MIVFYKNYNRLERTYLSIQSVRYLFPEIEIHCLLLYKNDINEYKKEHIKQLQECNVILHFDKKKYDFGSSGAGSSINGYYFTEMLNKIHSLTKEKTKVLMMDEDNFFTTGETLKFLINNEFDLAYGEWPHNIYSINASILCINCNKLQNIFPLPERQEFIEDFLSKELIDKCKKNNYVLKKIPTRNYIDYGGDGIFTNNITDMINELEKFNIKYKLLS